MSNSCLSRAEITLPGVALPGRSSARRQIATPKTFRRPTPQSSTCCGSRASSFSSRETSVRLSARRSRIAGRRSGWDERPFSLPLIMALQAARPRRFSTPSIRSGRSFRPGRIPTNIPHRQRSHGWKPPAPQSGARPSMAPSPRGYLQGAGSPGTRAANANRGGQQPSIDRRGLALAAEPTDACRGPEPYGFPLLTVDARAP